MSYHPQGVTNGGAMLEETTYRRRQRLGLAKLEKELAHYKRIARENELAAQLYKSLLELEQAPHDNSIPKPAGH
jgi:hypothetical protein